MQTDFSVSILYTENLAAQIVNLLFGVQYRYSRHPCLLYDFCDFFSKGLIKALKRFIQEYKVRLISKTSCYGYPPLLAAGQISGSAIVSASSSPSFSSQFTAFFISRSLITAKTFSAALILGSSLSS